MLSFSLPKLPKCVITDKEHLKCYQNRKLCVSYEKHNRGYNYFRCPKKDIWKWKKKIQRKITLKKLSVICMDIMGNYPGPLITVTQLLDKMYCLMKQRSGEFPQPHPSFSCFKSTRGTSYSQRLSEMDKRF